MAEINNPLTLTGRKFIPIGQIASEQNPNELKFSGDTHNPNSENSRRFYNMVFSGIAGILLLLVLLVSAHNRKYRTTPIIESSSVSQARSAQAVDEYKSSLAHKLCRGNNC